MSAFLRRQASFFTSKSSSSSTEPTEPLPSRLSSSPTSIPLVVPPSTYRPTFAVPLSSTQLQIISNLSTYALSFHGDGKLKEDDEYWESEKRWVEDEDNLKRYARAAKWNEAQAKKMLEASLQWRRDWRPEHILPSEVSHEASTGKQVLSGFDREGRPIIYLRPSRENTQPSMTQIRYLSYTLERAIDLAHQTGAEKLNIIIDYKQATQSKVPPWNIATKVLSMLQNHYVERLNRAYVVNTPWWMQAFFTAISPLLDPVTRDKIHMSKTSDLSNLLPSKQLDVEFGGSHNFVWEFEKYWETINGACGMMGGEGRKGERKERVLPVGQGDEVVEGGTTASPGTATTTTTTTATPEQSKAPSTAQTSLAPNDDAQAAQGQEGEEGKLEGEKNAEGREHSKAEARARAEMEGEGETATTEGTTTPALSTR